MDLSLRLALILSTLLIMVFSHRLPVEAATIKPTQQELCYLPAAELLKLFQAQVVSPVDVLHAQIERIEALNPQLKAITHTHYAEALAQAKASEMKYLQGTARALEGLTCAIKDDIKVKGWQSCMGSLTLKGVPPAEEDSALTAILREAGVVMHVQTNVPEFYCHVITWNYLYGICRNPWNLFYTPGGSSGGAAAALAAGLTTLAIGSDMGGSIRFPAAMTGLYGFKPPYGRVATSLTQYESEGPLTRTFEDMNLFQNALSGPSPLMISALRPKLEYPLHYGDIQGWKIAYDPMDQWGFPLDSTVKNSMEAAVDKLRALGAEVVRVDLGLRAADVETYSLGLFSTSMGALTFSLPEQYPELITPYVAAMVERYASEIGPKHLLAAEEWIYAHSNQIQEKIFTQGFKAIIMPTMCTPYVRADLGMHADTNVVIVDGQPFSVGTWAFFLTWPWNMLGQHPVVNVPIGTTPENIPLGMQIIGNAFDDLAAFQVAAAWAKVAPALYRDGSLPLLEELRWEEVE